MTGAIHSMHAGRGAPSGNAYLFADPPTQVTGNGGSTTIDCSGPGATVISDWVSLPEAFDGYQAVRACIRHDPQRQFPLFRRGPDQCRSLVHHGHRLRDAGRLRICFRGRVRSPDMKIEIQGVAAAPFVPNNFWQQLEAGPGAERATLSTQRQQAARAG